MQKGTKLTTDLLPLQTCPELAKELKRWKGLGRGQQAPLLILLLCKLIAP